MCRRNRVRERRGTPTSPILDSTASRQIGVALRRARSDDIGALVALESTAFSTDRLSRRSFHRLLASSSAVCLACEAEGTLIGYAMLLFRRSTSIARLYSIAIHPQWRGRGVASRLIAVIEEVARDRGARYLRLEVRDDNAAASALYEAHGFRQIGRRLDYYADHAAALRFEKSLEKDSAP